MILHNQNIDISENIKVFDSQYSCIKVKKSECPDVITMTSKALADVLRNNEGFWNSFDKVIIYYDNGQIELTKILTSVFSTLYTHVEFRKVKPVDYKLFQIADLICTMEFLAEKADTNSFSRSEMEFLFSGTVLAPLNTFTLLHRRKKASKENLGILKFTVLLNYQHCLQSVSSASSVFSVITPTFYNILNVSCHEHLAFTNAMTSSFFSIMFSSHSMSLYDIHL